MKLKLPLLFLLLTLAVFPQVSERLAVVTSAGTKYIPAYERQGTLYFSVIHFAEALSINYYFNADAQKIELKFSSYNLKITSKNPFIVLTGRGSDFSEEYQFDYHPAYYEQVKKRPFVLGMTAWNFADFGSEFRGDAIPHVNQKGLVNFNRSPKNIYYWW